jgi:hypothetical protein
MLSCRKVRDRILNGAIRHRASAASREDGFSHGNCPRVIRLNGIAADWIAASDGRFRLDFLL